MWLVNTSSNQCFTENYCFAVVASNSNWSRLYCRDWSKVSPGHLSKVGSSAQRKGATNCWWYVPPYAISSRKEKLSLCCLDSQHCPLGQVDCSQSWWPQPSWTDIMPGSQGKLRPVLLHLELLGSLVYLLLKVQRKTRDVKTSNFIQQWNIFLWWQRHRCFLQWSCYCTFSFWSRIKQFCTFLGQKRSFSIRSLIFMTFTRHRRRCARRHFFSAVVGRRRAAVNI